jgi:hypothetical protein
MRKHFSLILLLLCAGVFVFGLVRLFQLRFESGDIYPPYSSLRADPLGTMALRESLEALPGLSVRQDFSDANQLPEGRATTYLHLAARTYEWRWIDEDIFTEIDRFMIEGGRLVVTFHPEATEPVRFFDPDGRMAAEKAARQRRDGSDARRQKRKKAPDEEDESVPMISLRERWGVEFAFARLAQDEHNTLVPVPVENATDLMLPETLEWHTATVFTNVAPPWRIIYTRGTNPVVMERRFGAGSIVMATDSYFLSNEAMRKDRHPDFLAWLIGTSRNVVFDEAHFGIVETQGVATLLRKYRLHWLAGGLLLLAGLFIWKNSMSLVPAPEDAERQTHVAGKDAVSGFVNLLRRNVPPAELLNVCFAEWTKSLRHSAAHTISAVDRAQTVMEKEIARPERAREPVKAYREICRVLKTARNRQPPMDTNEDKPNEQTGTGS